MPSRQTRKGYARKTGFRSGPGKGILAIRGKIQPRKRLRINTLKTRGGFSAYVRNTNQTVGPNFGGFPNDLRGTLTFHSTQLIFSPVTTAADQFSFLRLNNPTQSLLNVNPSCPNTWNEMGAIYKKAVVTATKVQYKVITVRIDQSPAPNPIQPGLLEVISRVNSNSASTGSTVGEAERPTSVGQFYSTDNNNENPIQTAYYKNWEILGYNSAKDYEDDPGCQVPIQNALFAMPVGLETRLNFFIRNATFPPGSPAHDMSVQILFWMTFYVKYLDRRTIIASHSEPDPLVPPLP